jgi:hypothetical protein
MRPDVSLTVEMGARLITFDRPCHLFFLSSWREILGSLLTLG